MAIRNTPLKYVSSIVDTNLEELSEKQLETKSVCWSSFTLVHFGVYSESNSGYCCDTGCSCTGTMTLGSDGLCHWHLLCESVRAGGLKRLRLDVASDSG